MERKDQNELDGWERLDALVSAAARYRPHHRKDTPASGRRSTHRDAKLSRE
jgi:hypothetical protein